MIRMSGRGGSGYPALHSYLCAAITALSCLLHLVTIGRHHEAWVDVIVLAMVAACAVCVRHLWHRPATPALRRLMFMALGMAALHAVLLLAGGSHGHAHAGPVHEAAAAGAGSSAGTFALIIVELATALTASTLLARLRAYDRIPDPDRPWMTPSDAAVSG